FRQYLRNEYGPSQGNAQPLALANRIIRVPLMPPHHSAVRQNKNTTPDPLIYVVHSMTQEGSIVIVRQTADRVALGLISQFQLTNVRRHLPNFHFRETAKGKLRPRKVFLGYPPKHVRLIFVCVFSLGNDIPAVVLLADIRIMARRNELTIQFVRALEKCFPLDMGIAEYAWIGGAAGSIFVHKIVKIGRAHV